MKQETGGAAPGASASGSGAGAKTDRVYRLVRVMAIGGGSEEVMLDLAMRASKL